MLVRNGDRNGLPSQTFRAGPSSFALLFEDNDMIRSLAGTHDIAGPSGIHRQSFLRISR